MNPRSKLSSAIVLAAALLLAAWACGIDDVRIGDLRVSNVTTGGDPDRDGYRVFVDAIDADSLATDGNALLRGLSAGSHAVELRDVAPNCSISGNTPHLVTIQDGETAHVSFAVACVATGVEVAVASTGVDFDPDGFLVSVDGGAPVPIPSSGTIRITYLVAGAHSVALSGIAANCTLASPNPRGATVVSGGVAPVAFTVACVATSGALEVVATTTGVDFDIDGYAVQLDSGALQAVGSNGTVTLLGLAPGDHRLAISGAAANCAIAGASQRMVSITAGGAKRDTTRADVAASCTAVTGAVTILAQISGLDPDSLFTFRLDGGLVIPITPGSAFTIEGVGGGSHSIVLGDVAQNCTVGGSNPRTLSVTVGGATRDTVSSTFTIACVATTGSIEVTAATSGGDPDVNGYTVRIDGGAPSTLLSNGTMTFSRLAAGSHSVGISGVEPNCSVAGNPRAVTVTVGGATRDTARTRFDVSCVAVSGAVQVSVQTGGPDPDADGYGFRVIGLNFDAASNLGPNGAETMGRLPAGAYLVALSGVAQNCDVTGLNPRGVTITVGDTTALVFAVACSAASRLAVTIGDGTGGSDIFAVSSNGTGLTQLTGNSPGTDYAPAWSFDGTRVAFVSQRTGHAEIYAMNANGTGEAQLTRDASFNGHPTWSPDGTRIAFAGYRGGSPGDIWAMNADGTNPVRLTNTAAEDADPAWSPDGTRIAFVSNRDGNFEIYVMNPDGSNQTRITFTPEDEVQPDWSPSGLQLVTSRLVYCDYYYCDYDLVVMNVNGSGQVVLPSGSSDVNPVWSPDGRWIAFGASICDYYYGCYTNAVMAIRSDGTRLTELVPGGYLPSWRR